MQHPGDGKEHPAVTDYADIQQPPQSLQQQLDALEQDGTIYLKGVVSRKKQLIPPLMEAAQMIGSDYV